MRDQLRIAVFTIIEGATLAIWLVLARGATNIGSMLAALAVLVVGFTIEHIVAYNVIHNRGLFELQGAPIGKKAVVSLIESGIWALWLALTNRSAIVAIVVLTILLVVEHTLSDNVFKGKDIFSRFLDARTISFSLVEAVGAGIWLALVDVNMAIVGLVILLIASFIEHSLAVSLARQQTVSA